MIEQVIVARETEIAGGLRVKRILPFRARRSVGPFVFLDHMGPFNVKPGSGGDVPPHPHIGLSTVTYLFEGELIHRDSLGTVQPIFPGDLNWMTAGRGIAHSERVPERLRATGQVLHGLQAWVALPQKEEDSEPNFQHIDRSRLERFKIGGADVCLIAGKAFGRTSPVKTHSKLFYLSVRIPRGASFYFDPEGQEAAVYLVSGSIQVAGVAHSPASLIVFKTGAQLEMVATADTTLMLFGGQTLDGVRHIYWNFVSSSKEAIEEAKARWRNRKFAPVPDETEFVPLPEDA